MAMDDVAGASSSAAAAPQGSDGSHGWQTVSYPKRNRKQAQPAPRAGAPDLALNGGGGKAGVFDAVEKRSQERHRALQQQLASRAAYLDDPRVAVAAVSDDEDSDGPAAPRQEDEAAKKPKKPKVKKPKVTVAEAAALIDAENLAAHLVEISVTLLSPPRCPEVRSRGHGSDQVFIRLLAIGSGLALALDLIEHAEIPAKC
jgi:hypothetical protein